MIMEYSLNITLDDGLAPHLTSLAFDEAETAARLALKGLGRHLNVDESIALDVTSLGLQDATLFRLA